MALGFTSMLSFSQYYLITWPNANKNPGAINTDAEFPVGGGLPTSWTTIQGLSATPVWSANQTIPFSFSFNGTAVTSFKVSTSGVLTFDVTTSLSAPSYTKSSLPDASIPNNSVCIWGMSGLGANDNIVTKTFGAAPNRQLWIQFSSYSYGNTASDGNNFAYWSIVLEETTNKIHIVDNRTGGYSGTSKVSAGIQISASNAIAIVPSPNLPSKTAGNSTPDDNSYYTFTPGIQPNYDLSATNISTSNFLAAGNNTIAGSIKNLGTSAITSYTLNYKIDGGATVSSPITGANILTDSVAVFSHPTLWNGAIGTHTIDVWATNLNGSNADANTSDDHKTKVVNVLNELVQRIPLFEVFTSSTCGPCTAGNINYHSIVDTKPASDFASIKYQQDFPSTGDPYATTESVNRRTVTYAINSIPRMEIDGGWDQNASSFTDALYNSSGAVPAQFKMDGFYKLSGKSVSGTVKYSPLFNNVNAKVYIAIIENKTVKNKK